MENTSVEAHTPEDGVFILPNSAVRDITKLVSFMREDPDHVVFKRFEKVNLYHLLSLQHRLTLLEKQIASYEENDQASHLAKLILKLEPLIKDYNEALLVQDRLRRLPFTPRNVTSGLTAISERNLIELQHELEPEAGWSDIVSLGSNEKGWIHRFIDHHYQLKRLFRKPGTGDRPSNLLIYSEKAVRRTEQVLVNLSFCILVLSPIFLLSFIANKVAKLIIVLGFVMATSVLASVLSDNAQKSGLAIMAGYTAILVVFLSNNVGSAP